MSKKLVLIDLDDTLWDTWANNKESLNELYTALDWGRYFSSFDDFFADYYYAINHELWLQYSQESISKEELSIQRLQLPLAKRLDELIATEGLQGTTSELRKLVDNPRSYWQGANEQLLEYIRHKTRLCPSALELLKYLHSKYAVCILSNGFPEVQYSKLETSGLSPYVDKVVLSDEVGYNKPNPKIFAYALECMQVEREASVMIGDSWASDIEGAELSGIDSIWYNRYGVERPSGSTARPRAEVAHLMDITKYI